MAKSSFFSSKKSKSPTKKSKWNGFLTALIVVIIILIILFIVAKVVAMIAAAIALIGFAFWAWQLYNESKQEQYM